MTRWRKPGAPSVGDDLDGLLDHALRYAEDRLPEGGFAPVGFTLDVDGTVSLTAAGWDEDSGPPPAAEVLEGLREALRSARDHFRAVAVVLDAAMPDGSDVVQVDLEHAEGEALTVLMPYVRTADGLETAELRGVAGQPRTWA